MNRKIVLVHVEKESKSKGIFELMFGKYIAKLKQLPGVTFELVNTMDGLKKMLEQNRPDVIIFGDEMITSSKYRDFVLTGIEPFMESGGLVLLALGCLSFAKPSKFNKLMEILGLPWKYSVDYRTDFQLTSAGKALFPNLPEKCNAEAAQLSNVLPEHRIYSPAPGAKTYITSLHTDPSLAMVAFIRVGAGGFGVDGDINAEEVVNDITIRMCSARLN